MAINNYSIDTRRTIDAEALFCFSHLRWDFVFQRPQHLMSRFAQDMPVFFIEEPHVLDEPPMLEVSERGENLYRCIPTIPPNTAPEVADNIIRGLVNGLVSKYRSRTYLNWFYSPMMVEWARDLRPAATVYDCMDELTGFRGAPPELRRREADLFDLADVVFTGGHSLYEAKRNAHRAVYEFPSSIDVAHFRGARSFNGKLPDQDGIARKRVGFAGVIDERLDIDLLSAIAELRPDMNFVMIGPVVKIDQNALPKRNNIHYLGARQYADLPNYMAGWDAAIMPFAMNEATKFISPTKTPEYLAAGLPVVSTPITDVVKPYGEMKLVEIASDPAAFVKGIDAAIEADAQARQRKVDSFLRHRSWDMTFKAMTDLIEPAIRRRKAPATKEVGAGAGYAAATT